MTLTILATAARVRGAAVLSAAVLALPIHAQTDPEPIDPEAAAQLIAAGLAAQSRGMVTATSTGRHLDIAQTVTIPENATPKQMKAGSDAVHKLILERTCGSPNISVALRAGVDLTWTFHDQHGGTIADVHVDKDSCPAQGATTP